MGKKKKPIRIATPEKIASDLAAFKAVFDEVEIPWVIMGGIVLGYARYGEIMEWDTDVDVGVFVKIKDEQWSKILKAMRKQGFRVNHVRDDFKVGGREVVYNLWFFHKKGNFYEAKPRKVAAKGLKFVEKAKWYDEPQMVEFLDDEYPMPNHMEDYLVCQYGKDWRTNIVKDHEAYYLDKRGSRDTSKWLESRANKEGDLWPKTIRLNDSMEDKDELRDSADKEADPA
jgi:hypothetical protein